MDKETSDNNEAQARLVLSQHYYGVLSTNSRRFEGYPFGSVVPYCTDYEGRPLILISRLAQHTRNLQTDPKLSLLVLDRDSRARGNVQTDARLTLVGEAMKVEDADIAHCAARYYRHFPDTLGYHTELDFEFYCLMVSTLRFIPGFGQACWLSGEQVLKPNPFKPDEEQRIVDHMNEDHQDALLHYHRSAPMQRDSATDVNVESVAMVAIDGEGIVLRVNDGLERIRFSRQVNTPAEARQILVEMAQA